MYPSYSLPHGGVILHRAQRERMKDREELKIKTQEVFARFRMVTKMAGEILGV